MLTECQGCDSQLNPLCSSELFVQPCLNFTPTVNGACFNGYQFGGADNGLAFFVRHTFWPYGQNIMLVLLEAEFAQGSKLLRSR